MVQFTQINVIKLRQNFCEVILYAVWKSRKEHQALVRERVLYVGINKQPKGHKPNVV